MQGGIIIKNKKKIFIIIVTFALTFSAQISYARYLKTETLNAVQEIATPIFKVEEGNIIQINKINNTGYYEFSVKNFNERIVSEIWFSYTIEIISNLEDLVQFELYNGEKQIQLQNLKTEKIMITGNEKIEQKYKLKIIYNNTKEIKEESIEKIQIKLNSEQEKV